MRLGRWGVVPANFLSWATDLLVGVGLGCLLQISRSHAAEVKVSAGHSCKGPLLVRSPRGRPFPSQRRMLAGERCCLNL